MKSNYIHYIINKENRILLFQKGRWWSGNTVNIPIENPLVTVIEMDAIGKKVQTIYFSVTFSEDVRSVPKGHGMGLPVFFSTPLPKEIEETVDDLQRVIIPLIVEAKKSIVYYSPFKKKMNERFVIEPLASV